MGVKVTIHFDKAKLMQSVDTACTQGLEVVGTEALKDANYYARQDTGETIRSSIKASDLGKSIRLVWTTPYARRVYYTGRPSTETNPNASLLWAHKGAAENRQKYEGILRKFAAARKPGGGGV